jgi:hypothetical protein
LKGAMSRFFAVDLSDMYFTVFYMYVSVFILSVKLAKINWFNMCIKISGNNFITYMRKKTNLVIFLTWARPTLFTYLFLCQ